MKLSSLANVFHPGMRFDASPLRRFLAVLASGAALFSAVHAAPVYEPVAVFEHVPSFPSQGSLLRHTDGNFYGTSTRGGAQDFGTIYRMTPAGALSVVVHFNGTGGTAKGRSPNCRLVSDGAGLLWGTTQLGGTANHGTVFKVNPATGGLTTVVEFTGVGGAAKGSDPLAGLVGDGGGNFWGTTQLGGASDRGTVFRLNAAAGILTTLVEFTGVTGAAKGSDPKAGLVSDGAGNFWGTTQLGGVPNAGTVFRVNATTGALTSVLDFPSTGSTPRSPLGELVSDGAGNFWGTTPLGGAGNVGTIYRVNASSGTLTTVVQFTGNTGAAIGGAPSAELVSDGSGNFWGTTSNGGASGAGTIFKVRIATGLLTSVVAFTGNFGAVKGENPQAGLTRDAAGTSFWGTTLNSGSSPAGTVFRVNIATGALTTVVQFPNGLTGGKGKEPGGTLVADAAGNLWGTTRTGSGTGQGTVYKLNPATGALTTVVEFPNTSNNNRLPLGGVVNDGAGFFWGTTSDAGSFFNGSIFKVNATTGALTTPVLFTGTSGAARGTAPFEGLTNDGAGFLWGTTSRGGTGGNGSVFKVNIATGAFTTVADFTGNAGPVLGDNPTCQLLNDGVGNMWGTTRLGGASGGGTIFKINIATGAFANVVQFTGASGAARGSSPWAGLASDGAGNLWGTTSGGGALGFGTVFKVNRTSGALTTVLEFTGVSGAVRGTMPRSPLTLDGAGNFWGTTSAEGTTNLGSIFKVSLAGAFTNVFSFTGFGDAVPGQNPSFRGMLYHTDGNLYGAVPEGGFGGGGLIFRIRLDPTPPTGGALTVTPPSPVSPATAMTATASGWTDANLPLSYEFFLDAAPLGSRGVAASVNFSAPAASGQHTVTLRVFDALGAFAEVSQTFVVDNPPVARVATLGAVAGSASRIAVSKLQKYATDPDGDAFTIIAVSPGSAQGGTVTLSGGFITYTPSAGFSGADSFTYTLRDERGATAIGTVNVTVAAVGAPSFNVISITRTEEGFLVKFAGIPSAAYVIQFRDTMTAPWQTLVPPGAVTAGANGLFQFEDKPDPIPTSRFYRAAEAP